MRPMRPLFLTACLCLAALLASCTPGAAPKAGPAAAATPAATQAVATSTPAPKYYTVAEGDNLSAIAQQFDATVDELVKLNKLANPDDLVVGQRLLLPATADVTPEPVQAPVQATTQSAKPQAASASAGASEPQTADGIKVPILLYHHVDTLDQGASSDWYDSTVTPAEFDEQMAYLANNGYHSVKVMDVIAALGGGQALPAKPVVVSFDDGWVDCYNVALPILRKYNMIGSFFIPANWIGNVDGEMSWEQIAALAKAGMEIGSHSMTHPYLIKSEPDMLTWELEQSKALLEKHTGQKVQVLAYPFGLYDDNVVEQTKVAGYKAALSIEPGLYANQGNIYELRRLNIPYNTTLSQFKAAIGD